MDAEDLQPQAFTSLCIFALGLSFPNPRSICKPICRAAQKWQRSNSSKCNPQQMRDRNLWITPAEQLLAMFSQAPIQWPTVVLEIICSPFPDTVVLRLSVLHFLTHYVCLFLSWATRDYCANEPPAGVLVWVRFWVMQTNPYKYWAQVTWFDPVLALPQASF